MQNYCVVIKNQIMYEKLIILTDKTKYQFNLHQHHEMTDDIDKIKRDKDIHQHDRVYRGICIVHARYEGVLDVDIKSDDVSRSDRFSLLKNHNHSNTKQTSKTNMRIVTCGSCVDCGSRGYSESNRLTRTKQMMDIKSSMQGKTENSDNIDHLDKNMINRFRNIDLNSVKCTFPNTDVNKTRVSDYDTISSDNSNDDTDDSTDVSGKHKDKTITPKIISSTKSPLNHVHRDDVAHNFLHDFNNFFPDKFRMLRGSGYVKTIDNEQYVITCNHIMVKYASYVGYCIDIKDRIVKFNMMVYHRIPEIDIVVMKIMTPLDNPLPDLPVIENMSSVQNIDAMNQILTGELIPEYVQTKKRQIEIEQSLPSVDQLNHNVDTIFKTLDVNHQIHVVFDNLKSTHIHQIPLISVPIYEMEVIKKLESDHRINLKTDTMIMNTKRQDVSKMIAEKLSGTSGSIVRSNGANIGMICLYTDAQSGISLKAIPLFLVNLVVNNLITIGVKEFMGVQIDTQPCDIEYQHEQMQAHYVVRQSCGYINGKKIFAFNEGDIILEVNGKKFDKNRMLKSDVMKMCVPLNTYLMIRSNMYPQLPIPIRIAKQFNDDAKVRIHNLLCTPYNNMYCLNIASTDCCRWNDLVFMNLSEELLIFYKRLGIVIVNGTNLTHYASNNEKVVILFNFKKKIDDLNLTKDYYCSMPYQGRSGHYFYMLSHVGQKKITSVIDLAHILNRTTEQNKITFKFNDDAGTTKLLRVSF